MAENDREPSAQAAKTVRNHMIGSAAILLVPVPLVGAGILWGIQLRMLSQLSKIYGVKFSEQQANAMIGALAGVSVAAATGSILAMVPGVGYALGFVGAVTLPPASTYALGQVFIKHFESGGTFWTFDPDKAKAAYNEQLEEGKKVIEQSYAGIKP